ncbi:MAG: hypothetical protein GY934_22390 [Gammaproteobacteria bacterium]|nr:hypothetical protein [Gammaproteobacteria bacterium]
MAIINPITIALGAAYGIDVGKDIFGMVQQQGLAKKEISLQEKMMAGQLEGARAGNEANRAAAADYMALLQSEKAESRKDKNFNRRMQMLMMMMSGMGQLGGSAVNAQTQVDDIPPPPMGMMTLLRG